MISLDEGGFCKSGYLILILVLVLEIGLGLYGVPCC
jgi:hypothetical protein